ncbi:ATP-binding protein [Glaciecola petra]|uniref:histidine kinase n=1 Tax=Glaciecola petra TaxID=3075602 RepID=A0ABU2ZL27_9ALTE|nr:ATP-binding protein [Aestuariibacter sp. P117]MDT0593328.1 ATP-binding protein [Aestuariibacter sp. P117]
MINSLNSLRTRILISALLIVIIVLPGIGIALNNAFEQQVKENVQDQLNAYFYSILAVTEFENNELLMPEVLLENQFNVINSGLYALISNNANTIISNNENINKTATGNPENTSFESRILWFSNSFLGVNETLNLAKTLPQPELGESDFGQIELNQEMHFIYSFSVRFDQATETDAGTPLSPVITLHIIKDLASLSQQVESFQRQLWVWLVALIVILLIIQLFWLVWTLKPLARFTKELNAIQDGKIEQLSEQYPNELKAVARQLNTLLTNEQRQRQRYRNSLSDLAHSLKTPLAVMQSQQDLNSDSQEQISHINHIISRQLKRAKSAGNQAWHLGIEVTQVVDKLCAALAKIYPHIHIKYGQKPSTELIFRGDESDLTEILGNLLDNACKAAQRQILLNVYKDESLLVISIEDDGNGIPETQKLTILDRGKRADTYDQGHGIGLSIVLDLVHSYEGTLTIGESTVLGGARFAISFNTSKN